MKQPDLSVVIPVWAREHNLPRLIPAVRSAVRGAVDDHEIVVCSADASLRARVEALGARFVLAGGRGYGEILRAGFAAAEGAHVLTMDADFSHRPGYVRTMWDHRERGEVLIGSRYVRGAFPEMRFLRRSLSRALNLLYRKALALPYRDLSSGFRMFRAPVLADIGPPRGKGLDILPEMIVKAYCQGWKIEEVPFWYRGARPLTRMRMLRLGFGYLGTLGKAFGLRNSVKAADYDHRAFDSWIPLQRYWQRARFRIIQDYMTGEGRVLDIGCGSSRIVQTLPRVVGMDLALRKLRWLRAPGRPLLQGDMNRLPFRDGAFDAVVNSEVIEHIPREDVRLEELVRVIRPGGALILGTPDYGKRLWRTLEWIYGKIFPGGYVKEHINRYDHDELRGLLEDMGLAIEDVRYVGRSEMIFKARVPAGDRVSEAAPEPQPLGR
ncbi:MAG TPA: methyltransferase domain-containing protein [Actinomycetota bacterium]|nr:methyltransferase domain-containing protein [Actinomycetota bacterium]